MTQDSLTIILSWSPSAGLNSELRSLKPHAPLRETTPPTRNFLRLFENTTLGRRRTQCLGWLDTPPDTGQLQAWMEACAYLIRSTPPAYVTFLYDSNWMAQIVRRQAHPKRHKQMVHATRLLRQSLEATTRMTRTRTIHAKQSTPPGGPHPHRWPRERQMKSTSASWQRHVQPSKNNFLQIRLLRKHPGLHQSWQRK